MGESNHFSWFKWPFKKKQKMEIKENNIQEAKAYYSAFDFQWIKGEDLSMIEKFKDVTQNGDMMFIEFESGKRINSELLQEFMITFPAQVKQQIVQPVHQIQQVPNNPPVSNSHFSVTSIDYDDKKTANQDSPIYKLLKKQKKNMVDISIKLKLNLPPKELYSVLSGSFEDAEKEIIDFVLDGVDLDSIKASLSESIKKNYYSEKTKASEPDRKNRTEKAND